MKGTKEERQTRQSSGFREDNEDVAYKVGEVQQQVGGFSVKEKKKNNVTKCPFFKTKSESVEHRSKESIICKVQSETKKYFWTSAN